MRLWATVFLAHAVFAAQATTTAPLDGPILPCEAPDQANSTSFELSLRLLGKLGKLMYSDVVDNGWCMRLIEERIYGSLQLSTDLLSCGQAFKDHFGMLKEDKLKAQEYAGFVKSSYKESFEDCDDSSCQVRTFCKSLVKYVPCVESTTIIDDLYQNCLDDGWRFQELISTQSTDACQFKLVPQPYADTCPANVTRIDPNCLLGNTLDCKSTDKGHPFCPLGLACEAADASNPMCVWYTCQKANNCAVVFGKATGCRDRHGDHCEMDCSRNPKSASMPHCNMCLCKAMPWKPQCKMTCDQYPWMKSCEQKPSLNCSTATDLEKPGCWTKCDYNASIDAVVCKADCAKHPEHHSCVLSTTAPSVQTTDAATTVPVTDTITMTTVVSTTSGCPGPDKQSTADALAKKESGFGTFCEMAAHNIRQQPATLKQVCQMNVKMLAPGVGENLPIKEVCPTTCNPGLCAAFTRSPTTTPVATTASETTEASTTGCPGPDKLSIADATAKLESGFATFCEMVASNIKKQPGSLVGTCSLNVKMLAGGVGEDEQIKFVCPATCNPELCKNSLCPGPDKTSVADVAAKAESGFDTLCEMVADNIKKQPGWRELTCRLMVSTLIANSGETGSVGDVCPTTCNPDLCD